MSGYGHHSDLESAGRRKRNEKPSSDRGAMALLIFLYFIQGIPLGLSNGSIPFLLREEASYTAVGLFTLASYPYSLKLLWSPTVDSVYNRWLGRRRSWIIPIQTMSGLIMLFCGSFADRALHEGNLVGITLFFMGLVLFAATQDIAVDGWALTLLSRRNIGHASTCQTIGLNSGFFLSFTIFLALSDANFCRNYLGFDKEILSLGGYLRFWGVMYIICSLGLFCLPLENETSAKEENRYSNGSSNRILQNSAITADRFQSSPSENNLQRKTQSERLRSSYKKLLGLLRLKPMRMLTFLLLICRLGTLCAESVAVFKLMDKGVQKESLSMIILITYPSELVFAVVAGRWASRKGGAPLSGPWFQGYMLRHFLAIISTMLVYFFPTGASHFQAAPVAYLLVIISSMASSFASTLMFVSQGTFFAQIADGSMGGTYLTFLNTISNLGGSWPRPIIFAAIDFFSRRICVGTEYPASNFLCSNGGGGNSDEDQQCIDAGGTCELEWDGFYLLSVTLVILGSFMAYCLRPIIYKLEQAKPYEWKIPEKEG